MNEACKVSFDPVRAWLDNVACSHSQSLQTEELFTRYFARFCTFIKETPGQILEYYERSDDRQFRHKYSQLLRAFISALQQSEKSYAPKTICAAITSVKSFFKYNDLPLGNIELGKGRIVYHNREITKEEIVSILNADILLRDKAFFCMMAQSGLRPNELIKLRIKHIQPDFDKAVIPCKVEIEEENTKGKYGSYFTFIGPETVEKLHAYFKERESSLKRQNKPPKLSPESYVFTIQGHETQLNRFPVTRNFHRAVIGQQLDYKQRQKGKPGDLRLYTLRKWFRKQAAQAGSDYVNFWMGHSLGIDSHYFSRDVEVHRKQYKEKAMPFTRLESTTPTETEKQIEELRQENAALKLRLNHVAASTDGLETLLQRVSELEKKLKGLEA